MKAGGGGAENKGCLLCANWAAPGVLGLAQRVRGLAAHSLANWRAERSLVRMARELQLCHSRNEVNSFFLPRKEQI